MIDFWSTVRGAALADTLIRCLPKLTEEKPEQTVIRMNKDSEEDMAAMLKDINEQKIRYSGSFTDPVSGDLIVICERGD